VFAINGNYVCDVYVEGRVVVSNGKVTGVDEESIYSAARDRAEKIRQELGLPVNTPWPVD